MDSVAFFYPLLSQTFLFLFLEEFSGRAVIHYQILIFWGVCSSVYVIFHVHITYYLWLCKAQVLPKFNQLYCDDTIPFQTSNISYSLKFILVLFSINLL